MGRVASEIERDITCARVSVCVCVCVCVCVIERVRGKKNIGDCSEKKTRIAALMIFDE
jgi:hypothetical protein